MPFTDREKKANQRARQKGLPEPYQTGSIPSAASIEERLGQHEQDLAFALQQDAQPAFYKSECRPCVKLLAIYEGLALQEEEEDESEDDTEVKKRKRVAKNTKGLNPSITKITIPEIERLNDAIDPSVDEIVSFRRWLDLRDKARKDLYWLCKMLGKDLFPDVHQVICDQFVSKSFDGMYHKNYTLGQFHRMIDAQIRIDASGNPTKEMMLLDSRGFYKSTINGIDCVSWHINCPDAHIFILTGEYKLAVQFLQEIKDYYYFAKGSEPSPFHLLFPEYVLTGVKGTSKQPMKCPARVLKQKGNSLWVNAIVANLSGWHCDIKKGDDIVTDENSNNDDARASIKSKYDGTDDLLDPHGFSDHIGTRYFSSDWYGTRLQPDEDTKELASIKYFKRGCWTVKPEYRDTSLKMLTFEMVNLTFPQLGKTPREAFNKLRQKLLKKADKKNKNPYRAFCNQQLNEPTDDNEDSGFVIHFSKEVINAHTHPAQAVPVDGEVFILWDWALSDKKTSDYSVGIAVKIYKKTNGQYAVYVLEIIYDKWKDSELVRQMIAFYKKYKGLGQFKRMYVENSNGGELLKTALQNAAYKLNALDMMGENVICWIPVDTRANAKRNRIKSIETLLDDDRLDFVDSSLYMEEVIKQLTQYTGEKSTAFRKDDIPDALSFLVYPLPAIALQIDVSTEEVEKEMETRRREEQSKAAYKQMFGGHNPLPAKPTSAEPAQKPRDPRLALFGGSGWRM